MGTEAYIGLPYDEPGKKSRTISSTIGEYEVHTTVVALTDNTGTIVNPGQMGGVSSANSSTTALDNGQTYTGDWEDVSKYDSITVAVSTDQNGTYTVQFSPDGTNQDSTLTRYYRTGAIEPPHRFTITRRYFRISFTNNSGSNQSYFRLQSMYGTKQPLNVPLDGTVSRDYDATVVRPTGYEHEVALGLRQGATTWHKWGYNEDVDTATDPEIIAAFGETYIPPSVVSTLRLSSSDANDASVVGTGARSYLIYGINGARRAQNETVVSNGTTSVATTGSFLGINRMVVLSSGSNRANVGSVVAINSAGSIWGFIPAGEGVTQQLFFHTQNNHKAEVDNVRLNAQPIGGGNPVVTFRGIAWNPGTNTNYELFREVIDTAVLTSIEWSPKNPIQLSGGDVFYFTAETTANNTRVGGRFDLIEYKDVDAT